MMKVVVSEYLNVRVGRPSLNAPCYQYLAPGSELEVDGISYKGDAFEGSDDWLKDEAGNYYWRGGVKEKVQSEIIETDYWFKQLGIFNIWKEYDERGDFATVLILDSGINQLKVFSDIIIDVQNFVPNSQDSFSNDIFCHGTHCAGLIASLSSQYSVGVAPKAKLIIGKIAETDQLNGTSTLIAALNEFIKPKYDGLFNIISISAAVIQEDMLLKNIIDQHIKKQRIIVASIGNDPLRKNKNLIRYPGYFENCISVGACEKNLSLSRYTCFPKKANIYCYGTNIGSFKKNEYPEPLDGTSQANAIVAGICALIVSYLRKQPSLNYNQDSIRYLLKKYSLPLVGFPEFRAINPDLIFLKLSKFKNHEIKDLQVCIDNDSDVFS